MQRRYRGRSSFSKGLKDVSKSEWRRVRAVRSNARATWCGYAEQPGGVELRPTLRRAVGRRSRPAAETLGRPLFALLSCVAPASLVVSSPSRLVMGSATRASADRERHGSAARRRRSPAPPGGRPWVRRRRDAEDGVAARDEVGCGRAQLEATHQHARGSLHRPRAILPGRAPRAVRGRRPRAPPRRSPPPPSRRTRSAVRAGSAGGAPRPWSSSIATAPK
jgi:hypothetical protein